MIELPEELVRLMERKECQAKRVGELRRKSAELKSEREAAERKLLEIERQYRSALAASGSWGRNQDERQMNLENALSSDSEAVRLREKIEALNAEIRITDADMQAEYDLLRSMLADAEIWAAVLHSAPPELLKFLQPPE